MNIIIQFALRQRLLILLLIGLLVGGGYHAFQNLPIDAFPEVSPTQVKIIVKANGMTPEEVENRITVPIELEMLGIPNQAMLRSLSKYAITDITIDFVEGTDIYWARQQVAERLNTIWSSLPEGIDGGIAPMTTPLGEMFMFSIEGGELDLMQRRTLLDWVIRPALRAVPGVAEVNSLGGTVRSYVVVPDNERMTARHVTMERLLSVLQHNNRNDGAGRLLEGEEALIVRAQGRLQNEHDIRALVVATRQGLPITVGDVADVKIEGLTRYGAVSKDGQGEAVTGLVLSLRGANAGQIVADIQAKIAEISSGFPDGVYINVFYNRGTLVEQAVGTVSSSLLQATVLVIIVLLLFLGDLRAALTVALSLPLAALFTFIVMRYFDMSANLMSLGGLAIAIGMLVDGAVVVVENIATQFTQQEKTRRLPLLHLIYRAARDVAVPVVSGTLIIVVVFLPLLTLQGLEGKLFAPVALTIVFALTGSLVLSLTVIPVLASLLLKQVDEREPWLPRKTQQLYVPLLSWCLTHRNSVFGVTGVMLVLALFAFTRLGSTFMPTMDEGDIIVQVEKLPSITLEQSIALDVQLQKSILAHIPEVTQIVSRVGTDELGLDPMSLNDTDTFMMLKPKDQWRMRSKTELIEDIRRVMGKLPGFAYGFTQPIEMRVAEMLTGTRGDVAVKLFGNDLALLNAKAEEIVALLKTVSGASDVFSRENEGMQFLQLDINQSAAERWGVSVDTLQRLLRAQIEGVQTGIVQEGLIRTPLIVRGSGAGAEFENLLLTLPGGESIPLTHVAKISRVEGLVAIEREQGRRFAVVRSNVVGRDLVSFVNDAKQQIAEKIDLPTGFHVEFGGQFQNQQRAAERLSLVVPVSLGLIFLLLFSTFGSIRQAVLVLANVPLALIGGIFALLLFDEYLSVPASVGFITLLGIAVLNGVVLVNYFNQLAATGMPISEVVLTGSRRRLRPVLMTACTTAFGLIPLLFASGPGSEIQRPLAIVVIGGLVSSTLLTLVVLPILYQLFGRFEGQQA